MSGYSQIQTICHDCGWVVHQPELAKREMASCPRCNAKLSNHRVFKPETITAWALAALLSLGLALMFRYMRFEARGVENSIHLFDAPLALIGNGFTFLAVIVALTAIVLPAIYLLGVLYLAMCSLCDRALPGAWYVAHSITLVRPWLMADVFVIGVLVSLIKIVTLADISLGPSFFAYCSFALLVLYTTHIFDTRLFWSRFGRPQSAPKNLIAGQSAAIQGVVECDSCSACYTCDGRRHCPCCGRAHGRPQAKRVQWTSALLISAAFLLVPANMLPMMITKSLGYDTRSTIIGGVTQLIQMGSWPIAIIIFIASIMVPISKILILGGICLKVGVGTSTSAKRRAQLYRVTEFIGRWSMIDVFVVSVLSALIQAGGLMAVIPGSAAVPFTCAVILTMLAVMTFDPRLIWQLNVHEEKNSKV